jgi:hypothetical protein
MNEKYKEESEEEGPPTHPRRNRAKKPPHQGM